MHHVPANPRRRACAARVTVVVLCVCPFVCQQVWGHQSRVGGHDTRELGAAAVESIAMDGQSIGSKVAAAVTHNSESQSVLGRGARLRLGSRRTRYTVGGHTK